MFKKIREYENWLDDQLSLDSPRYSELICLHSEYIKWIQHERLSHLLTTIFVGLILLAFFILFLLTSIILTGIIFLLLLMLFSFYIIHYFKLENSTQRFYIIYIELWNKLNN